MCWSLFFNKFPSLRAAALLKKKLQNGCFSVNFIKPLRAPILQSTSGRTLLLLQKNIMSSDDIILPLRNQ